MAIGANSPKALVDLTIFACYAVVTDLVALFHLRTFLHLSDHDPFLLTHCRDSGELPRNYSYPLSHQHVQTKRSLTNE